MKCSSILCLSNFGSNASRLVEPQKNKRDRPHLAAENTRLNVARCTDHRSSAGWATRELRCVQALRAETTLAFKLPLQVPTMACATATAGVGNSGFKYGTVSRDFFNLSVRCGFEQLNTFFSFFCIAMQGSEYSIPMIKIFL